MEVKRITNCLENIRVQMRRYLLFIRKLTVIIESENIYFSSDVRRFLWYRPILIASKFHMYSYISVIP
jgi:hypothetical protein